ncbi:MAG: hypothetical protein AAB495_01035 [Patescibacteria group bacterium]
MIIRFFDRLEDHARRWFSHYPILYAFVGGTGIVLFWRGVWHTTDYLVLCLRVCKFGSGTINLEDSLWWDGPLSILLGGTILLVTGTFVSNFIGNEIIITGLRGEKRIAEKTEMEVRTKVGAIGDIKHEVLRIGEVLDKEFAKHHRDGEREKKNELPDRRVP